MQRFNVSLRRLARGKLLRLLPAAAYTFAFWLVFFSFAPVLLQSLGYPVPWLAAYLRQLIFYFILSYVPLPGGSGLAEIGIAALFSSFVPGLILGSFLKWYKEYVSKWD